MMFTLLPYILTSYKAAFLTRSLCIPVAWMVVFHFFVIRPSFYPNATYSWLTDLQGDVFYPLVFFCFAFLGRGMACSTSTRGAVTRFEAQGENWGHYFLRLFKVLFYIGATFAATLAYEYLLPAWYGFSITLVALLIMDVLFVFMFIPKKVAPEGWKMMFYDTYLSMKPVGRVTMAILLAVFDIVVTVVFGLVTCAERNYPAKYEKWSQFYTAIIIFGAFLIELIVVAIIYFVNKGETKFKFLTQKDDPDTPLGMRKTN